MPELDNVEDEEVEVRNLAVCDLDTQKKQSNKVYVDKRFHARDWNAGEGDSALIEKKKDNKLSSGDIWLWEPGGIAVVLTN